MGKTIHQGRNVKRFREMLGIKQDALAAELGEDWNQRKISLLEQKEIIDEELLIEIAKALKVPMEAIKNFDEEMAIFNIQHNYEGSTLNNQISSKHMDYKPTFNPLDKYVEVVEKNEKLYTALLKEKDDKISLLEKMLEVAR